MRKDALRIGRERMPAASGKCLWAGFGRGTRRHHEADVQHSGSKAQHPSQPAPAGVAGFYISSDY